MRGTILLGALLAAALGLLSTPALADQPSDLWITTKVKMALLAEEGLGALEINVDTFDGTVTLHGTVAADAQKSRAETQARSIEGVQDVRNLVAVVPETRKEAVSADDEALRKRVATALEEDKGLADSDIDVVSVNDGVVVIGGEAETLTAHWHAMEVAQSVDGVRRVASEIQSPDELGDAEIWLDEGEAGAAERKLSTAASDLWITTKAKVRLMTEPGLWPTAINVDTRDGVVTLFGSVPSDEIRRRAAAQIGKVAGVRSVENELQVVPDVAAAKIESSDEKLLEAIRRRLRERQALRDDSIDVAVANGVARLTGTVGSQGDRLTALTVARATEGVKSVVDDLEVKSPRG